MAIHGNGYYGNSKAAFQRDGSFNDNIQLTFADVDTSPSSQRDVSSSSTTMASDVSAKRGIVVGFVFILELLILVFVCVLVDIVSIRILSRRI